MVMVELAIYTFSRASGKTFNSSRLQLVVSLVS